MVKNFYKLEELEGHSNQKGTRFAKIVSVGARSVLVERLVNHDFIGREVVNEIPRYSDKQVIEELNAMGLDVQQVTLTAEQLIELEYFRTVAKGRYLAKDASGSVYAYIDKPIKARENLWWRGDKAIVSPSLRCSYDFIRWEDEEPTLIDDLLDIGGE